MANCFYFPLIPIAIGSSDLNAALTFADRFLFFIYEKISVYLREAFL
ncbi:hypothetical protein NIASO_01715 [Niabella soli DSM 19437]|uniref:Uncharacterized protein n=1 Tax=Niabella soli DSM 19437 TaxID=929713 RepID=W0F6L4_9BACT|nr:hypothetical protein NIASO_01715 [Niabella soli DSM 19437]